MAFFQLSLDTVASIGTGAVCSAISGYVGVRVALATVKEKVNSLEKWRDEEAKPMFLEHDRKLAAKHSAKAGHD